MLMCAAFLVFTFLDTSAKLLAEEMNSLQIVWARFVGHAVLVAAVLMPRKGSRVLASSNLKLQIVRSEIGRASCRERVCPYGWISVGSVSLKKKKKNKTEN